MTFERFTERARQVVILAEEEARTSNSAFIDLEHLFAGLLREESGLAAQVIRYLNIKLPSYRALPKDDCEHRTKIAYTADVKQVSELALREALSLGHNYIGTEHILLALCRAEFDHQRYFGDRPAQLVRDSVIRMLAGPQKQPVQPKPQPHAATVRAALMIVREALDLAIQGLDGVR